MLNTEPLKSIWMNEHSWLFTQVRLWLNGQCEPASKQCRYIVKPSSISSLNPGRRNETGSSGRHILHIITISGIKIDQNFHLRIWATSFSRHLCVIEVQQVFYPSLRVCSFTGHQNSLVLCKWWQLLLGNGGVSIPILVDTAPAPLHEQVDFETIRIIIIVIK